MALAHSDFVDRDVLDVLQARLVVMAFEMLLLDVTPLSLGIKSAGGTFTRLIEANTTVPVTRRKVFTTVQNEQEAVRIQVYQGEHPVAEDEWPAMLDRWFGMTP